MGQYHGSASTFPFHSQSDLHYHAWIGLYITSWAALEYGLHNLIKTVKVFLKEDVRSSNKPMQLSNKLKLLNKIFTAESILSHETNESLAIFSFVEDESKFRHHVIHGVSAEFKKREPWYGLMWRPEHSNEGPQQADIVFVDEATLKEHYDMIGTAVLAIIGLTARILQLAEDQAERRP